MPSTCTICLDDHAEICFECVSPHCEYALCDPCLVDALKDCSGSNSEKCPMCKHPSAIRMATACIGVGGVMAVERGLRDRVEHDIRKQLEHKAFDRKEASMTNQKAVDIFNQITEELNLKCPRCETVFYDYEGCNALKCSQGKCGAAFCAICLQDCGRDAHTHVRKNHGDLFDKGMFKRNAAARANQVIKDSLHALEEEGSPFELTQAVKNHLDKAGYLGSNRDTNTAPFRAIKFIGQATKELESVIESDRLSVLVDSRGAEWRRSGITFDSVSPRACIPQDTRVWLLADNDEYELQVQCFIEDRWASTTSPEQVKEWIKDGVIPPSGLLSNLSQSLRASIVAFEGSKKLYQIIRQPGSVGSEKTKLKFYEVVSKGKIEQDSTPAPIGFAGRQRVLALNPNHRYLELLKHIENNVSHESLPNPICHFIGCGASEPVLTELETMLPSSFESLNQDQRSAGHPLLLRSAGEVAGPPGTGKTKTISELVRALLSCTQKGIVVLSERNGAIDAIAEKFSSLCIDNKSPGTRKVTDLEVWSSILTFGSSDAMGANTKLFLLDEKVRYHPEVVEAIKLVKERESYWKKHARKMLGQVAQAIKEFAERFDDNRAWLQYSRLTNTRVKGLDSPNLIHRYVKETLTGIISLLESGVTEADLDDLLERTDDLMRNLFPLIFVKADATKRLQDLKKRLSSNLESDLFDADEIQKIDSSYKAAQESKKKTEERIKEELQTMPRLRMSTIGSSHQLFASSKSGDDDQEALPLDRLKNLALCDDNSVDSQDAIVIFDESGCIPSYELLGLSRLGCGIAAILAVGDKQQLPPYSPATPNNRTKRGVQVPEETKLRSILDVSELKDKKALRKQYRVPRDIADILNARVYRGNYSTPPRAPVVGRGLKFRHVDFSESHRKKYVNPSEVDEVLHILNTSSAHSFETIMVLTPYKNQQREIQFQLRRQMDGGRVTNKYDNITVLTIDQCQGQEAELVILSLVRKPTRFLNKNRLNVAMSRTKKQLIILCDRFKFHQASQDTSWECCYMAQDILRDAIDEDD